MNNRPESPIEERLRTHYGHLRTQQPTHREPTRESRVLAGVACLILTLVAGGAYVGIRNAEPSQPINADVGAVTDSSIGESTELSVAPAPETPDTTAVAPTSEPSSTTAMGTDHDQTAPVASTATSDPSRPDTNVDGSPLAPTPGTVNPPVGAALSLAFGIWEPAANDSCSKEIHDSYWVYGPDGKVYPTYHPPIDPSSGCSFGHEHGRDPAGSDLADIPFPFGYIEEQALAADGRSPSNDHVGHKIEWYNDGGYYESGSSNLDHDQICDVAYKLHMDTHSDDAFENNVNEVFHYARCENGSELIYRALHRFGTPGQFNMHCDQGAGPAVILSQDQQSQQNEHPDDRQGGREIPSSQCFEDRVLVPEGQQSDWFTFDERWTLHRTVDSEDFGRFSIQFFFFADLPSRYWDGEKLARTVDLCYITGDRQVRDDEFCEPMRLANQGQQVQWDDTASPFNGANRQVFMIDIWVDNKARQTDWYTDTYGGVWSAQPFPGSIRQHVGTIPINAAASYRPDPIRSITFDDDVGIHAPN